MFSVETSLLKTSRNSWLPYKTGTYALYHGSIDDADAVRRADTTNSVITTLDEKLSNLRSDKVTADNSALSLQELTEKRIKEITEKREKGLTGKGSLKNTTNSMKTVINVDDDSMEVDEDLSGRGKGRAKGSTKDENRSIMGRLKRNRF
jgi:TolA-binding protein